MATNTNNTPYESSPPKPMSPSSPTSQSNPRSFMNFARGQPTTTSTPVHVNGILDAPSGLHYVDFIRTWSDTHVARWLTDIKCGTHASTFRLNDIRGDIILELDQQTLKEMGVSSIGDRLRIVNAVKTLRQRVASPALDRARTDHIEAKPPHPHYGNSSERTLRDPIQSNVNRLASRSTRPAPLQLTPNLNKRDLPGVEPDSAKRTSVNRPLPLPNTLTAQLNAQSSPGNAFAVLQPSSRANLPRLAAKPSPLPGHPTSCPSNSHTAGGRRTPTQGDPPSTSHLASLLPQGRELLAPSSASNWGGYGLPPDPRSGSLGTNKVVSSRSPSPLLSGRTRPPTSGLSHSRNNSVGPSSPVGQNTPVRLPPRPATGNGHPFANAQLAQTQPQPAQNASLSPIAESFITQHSFSGAPSPPLIAYTAGRGNFNSTSASHVTGSVPLETLRRKLIKFVLPEEGLSSTIEVATCVGGIEILEKVLKKFGKGSSRSVDITVSDHVQFEEGGLSIDGWGVYLGDGTGAPLTEAELLSICHAPPNHPTREHGLTVRKIVESWPHDAESNSFTQNKSLSPQASKNTKRASSISILSGLGVRDPEKALDPPSPTSDALSPAALIAKRPSKLRNFFGQRPPSELITNHLTEYFPTVEKKVLERTARHSMMLRAGRDSRLPSFGQSQWLSGNFPEVAQNQQFVPITSSDIPRSNAASPERRDAATALSDDLPRMSLSTDDGHSVELHPQDADEVTAVSTGPPPQLLPPIPFPSEPFSESFDSFHRVSTLGSSTSRPISYMTELRSKRDRSDTASLMTVDEITAEVESRRASRNVESRFVSDEWSGVDSDDDLEHGAVEDSLKDAIPEDLAPSEVGPEVEVLEDVDEDEEVSEALTSLGGNKWIKGALIGAGSFGKVYLGMDAATGLLMAVKQVELPTGSALNQERKKSMLSALEREIELLKNLQHANIVQYLYSSLDDEHLNIFLEYVPGGSVTALLRNYGAFEEPLVKNFVRQILEGLNYLHERDIIHRDIKGANILVDNKGGIKISDFGISKKVDDNLLAGNRANRPSLQGSVFWMAPEVVKQSAHTQKADIWSVGCLVVEMLTGEHPWAQLTQMQAIFKIGSSAKPTMPSDISIDARDFLQLTFELDHTLRPSAAQLSYHQWIHKKRGNNPKALSPLPLDS